MSARDWYCRRLVLLWLVLALASNGWRGLTRPWASDGPLPEGMRSVDVVAVTGEEKGPGTIRLAYREWPGADGGPVVLFVHGSPGSARDFSRVADAVSDRYRRISVDLPGFGASTRNLPDYSSRAHALYLMELLDALHIDRVHLVGHSLGGAVLLEMAQRDPERVQSLVMISAVGVVELELVGDYELNHAIHGLQLAVLQGLTWSVPHFGLLDGFPLGLPYARNFYDTDQRPLRTVLERLFVPLRILHGRKDLQVPVEAAIEHHRIAPHSEMGIWEDQSHFAIFTRPEVVAADVTDFIYRVEAGTARTRAQATPEEIEQALVPYDPTLQGPASDMGAAVLGLLLALATLVSEDAASVSAGLLVGYGRLPFLTAVGFIFVGIFGGDVLCVLFGRLIGRQSLKLLELWPLSWFVRPGDVDRAASFLARNGAGVVFASRFVPGTRFAVYVTAGILEVPLLGFVMWLGIAAALWSVLVVSATALLGRAATDLFDRGGLLAGLLVVLALVMLLRLLVPLVTWRGRRHLVGAWRRWTWWEFWPPWLFYPPVLLYGLWLAARHRPITVFTAVNPGIPAGGLVGESKWDIFLRLGLVDPARAGHAFLPQTRRIPADHLLEQRLSMVASFLEEHGGFPVVLKPDVGQRGDGVQIIRTQDELQSYLEQAKGDVLVQRYVSGHEVGLFYLRHPSREQGELFSITRKLPLDVTGDGVHSLEWLILADARAVCMAPAHLERFDAQLDAIPAAGEVVRIQELGTHSRGSIFQDGAELGTDALRATLDRITRDFEGGFFFGRFDVRCSSLEELAAGDGFSILELNGVTSEATHIYGGGLLAAWRTLMRQWQLAYEIGAANHTAGAASTSLPELFRLWWRYRSETSPSHATR